MALSELYSDRILDLAGNAPQPGRLVTPDGSARKVSKLCGSVIEVDISVRNGVIAAYGHDVSACALGQTSAAVVAREIVGTPVAEFAAVHTAMRAMLAGSGPAPSGKWADLAFLEPVRDFPARHGSVLLVFDAIAAALEKAESVQKLTADR